MSGGAANGIDRGGICQTEPSGWRAYVDAGLRAWVWEGTVGVLGMVEAAAGTGAMAFGGGLHIAEGGTPFIMAGFPPVMLASSWGSEMVVNSSHGTEGSSGGAAVNSADPTGGPDPHSWSVTGRCWGVFSLATHLVRMKPWDRRQKRWG